MKTLAIEFEEYPGEVVDVRISPVSVTDFFKVQNVMRSLRVAEESFVDLATTFAPFIESWSFPEPIGVDGLMARDYNWFIAVVSLWVKGVRDVPLPLPLKSSDGEPSEDQMTSPENSTGLSSSTPS